MGESCDVLIMEIEKKNYPKVLKVDNTAAVNILQEPAGSWRTRHLRWRIGKLDWLIEAIPGDIQVADVGTKSLPSTRLEELKARMGMEEKTPKEVGEHYPEKAQKLTRKEAENPKEEGKEGGIEEGEGGMRTGAQVEQLLRMVILMASLSKSKAQGPEEDESGSDIFLVAMATFFFVFLVGLAMIVLRSFQGVRRLVRG